MDNQKRNLTRKEGLALVSRYRESGLTQAKFAETAGVTKAALQYWIQKERKAALAASNAMAPVQFVEVVGRKSTVSSFGTGGTTMEFAVGRMRFETLPPPEYVARIALEMAKGLPC